MDPVFAIARVGYPLEFYCKPALFISIRRQRPAARTKVFTFYLAFAPLSACLGNLAEGYGVNDFIILIVTMLANFVLEFLFCKFVVCREKREHVEQMMKNNTTRTKKDETSYKKVMSSTRKQYIARLIGRIVIFAVCLLLCLDPQAYDILKGMNFFKGFHIFHLLWLIWVCDMILQMIPIKNTVALGSQKLFANRFRPIRDKINYKALKTYIVSTTAAAYKVLILWVLLIAGIGVLYYCKIINEIWLFMISVFFYVCDLICVLIWCPFRLIMKNKCCTTCRIFNWDHLMMFSPIIFIGGFFSISLVIMAVLAWLVWEICVLLYPERFCEMTNAALKCSECTDKLCTQYCQKLRKH